VVIEFTDLFPHSGTLQNGGSSQVRPLPPTQWG
jgi:hypothetical protein